MAAIELQRGLNQSDEERDDGNDADPDPKDVAPEPMHDFRQVRLHTEPVVHKRGVAHWLAGTLGLQYDDETGVEATNEILTARYTLLTFLPKNLFMQFTRVANLYFLLIAGLQLIPGLSPTSWFTTVFPLCCVLIINAIKEIVDDVGRHRSDEETNSRQVLLLSRGGREEAIPWRDIRCGHVVKIRQDEEVPADCIILSTSDETHLCHVETANLDGETNLKLKYSFEGTKTAHTADQLKEFEERLAVHTEMPNTKLYSFDGSVVEAVDPAHNQLPLTVDNLLLRGCTLRKTNWVIGLVVFAGADTKIMMNRTPAKRKVTQLERHMNILVLCMFGAQFLISAMMSTGGQAYQAKNQDMWYLQWTGEWPDLYTGFGAWVIQVIRWIIVLNGMIPISLYVTLEMVKVIQCAWVLNSDRKMYLEDTDTPFRCRTTNLNEDLGQVEYVLSDKTGTLTQNVMGFVWASIDKHLYGKSDLSAIPEAHQANAKAGKPGVRPSHVPEKTAHSLLLDPELQAKLGKPFAQLAGNSAGTSQTPPDDAVATFFICLAVCNTVVPQVLEDGRFVYQASSPDEEALVEGAAMAGYKLVSRSTTQCEVEYHGQRHLYKTLVVLEFNSDRKRMSIICKCPDGKIRLFSKGADTMMMTRIAQNQPITLHVRNHLADMAQVGYRTLVVAQKEITNDIWNTWWSTYHAASVAIEDREHKIAQTAEKIEVDLDLLGATAVEDKLQDGVPDAISKMVDAGIKVWVLTGDKVETAISIAFSCRLFTDNMAIVELRDRDFERAMAQAGVQRSNKTGHFSEAVGGTMDQVIDVEAGVLKMKLDEVHAENIRLAAEEQNKSLRHSMVRGGSLGHESGAGSHSAHVGLVIEGGALAVGLQKEHQDLLIQLLSSCKSVVCCRVSPMQKAAVTKLVQVKCNAIVLGIGDGANDVGMIQAAHIGCGISGREGRAAVMASDYSFAQFRYVARLLLVHGRSAYTRNTEVVIYSFYKNWLWNWTYVYFAFVTVWSAQPLYTSGLIATFNLFWAALPIVIYAFTEQEVSQQTLMNCPLLYGDSMRATRRTFLISQLQWLGLAQWHSLVNYFIPMYSMGMTNDSHGRQTDWVMVGCTVYTAMILTVNLKLALRTRYWTWMNHVSIWPISIGLWFPFLYLYGLVWPVANVDGTADMSDIAIQLWPNPFFWLGGVLLAPAMSLLLDIAIMTFRKHLNPKPAEILQEYEYQEDIKRQAMQELGLGYAPNHHTQAPPKLMENNSILGRADMPSRSVVVTELQAIDAMEPRKISLNGAGPSGALLLP